MAPNSGIVSCSNVPNRPSISKRAARRLIQQAFVLTARDRSVRQHIREVRLATLWVLEDWKFEWTVHLDRGKVRFDRRPVRIADATLTWPSGEEFFASVEEGCVPDKSLTIEGHSQVQVYIDAVYRSFAAPWNKS